MPVKVNCVVCGKEFLIKQSRVNKGWGKCCSRKCTYIYLTGRKRGPHSAIHRKRIGESNKRAFAEGRKSMAGAKNPRYGKHCSEETKQKIRLTQLGKVGMPGKLNPMYGKHPSEESKKKSADAQRGKPKHSEEYKKMLSEKYKKFNPMSTPEANHKRSEVLKGKLILDQNPNWKGGVSFEPYCIKFNKEFKERVRTFFNHQCVECGSPENGYKLHIHHVNYHKGICCDPSVPRLFVGLCNTCHLKTNGKRECWELHFTELINTYYGGKCYLTKEEMNAISGLSS